MRRTLALALGLATVVGLAGPAAAAEAEAPTLDSPDHRVVVPMACKVMQRERQLGVACAWREAGPPATGYRLGRLELGGRRIIFRTADLTKHAFLDLKVRPGLQYAYVLQVLDGAGGVIGQSRHQLVLVRPNGGADRTTTTTTTAPGSTATGDVTRRPIGIRPVRPTLPPRPTSTLRQRPGVSTTLPTTSTSTTAATPVTTAPPTTIGATRS